MGSPTGYYGTMTSVVDEYSQGEDRPLGGYVGTMSVYAGLVGLLTLFARTRRRQLPSRLRWDDLVVGSVATFRFARLLAKDTVTSPIRAPFTRFKGTSGPSELEEDVRGSGARKAVGELITCPFCLAQWVATLIAFGFLIAPRATRVFSYVMTIVAGADFLQLAYDAAEPDPG